MKSVISHKENNYSLNNIENYRKTIDCSLGEVTKIYGDLLIEYSNFISENIKVKNSSFSRFIIIRGLDTITNVFNNILYFTKNIELTYFHCQKSYYFYVEFVGQISEDDKMFLQLTSRDATTYVYKKTIFELNSELKKLHEDNSDSFREKIDTINSYINLYQSYLLKIINSEKITNEDIDIFLKLCDKLNKLPNKVKINTLNNVIDKLYHKIEDKKIFLELNQLIVKQFLKNQEIIEKYEKKILCCEFEEKLSESSEKFIKWFTI